MHSRAANWYALCATLVCAQDLIGSRFLGLRFSISTVKYLMSIFDFDNRRGIGFQEFEALWNYITQWRQIFALFDVDRNGKIDADKLGRALAHFDLRVGPPVLDLLFKKYASAPLRNRSHYGDPPPRPQIDLDRFVCACIVVRQMCRLYDQCHDYGPAQINRDDFLRAVISLLC
ncbi:EF-hand, partial [Lactarius tabidus]